MGLSLWTQMSSWEKLPPSSDPSLTLGSFSMEGCCYDVITTGLLCLHTSCSRTCHGSLLEYQVVASRSHFLRPSVSHHPTHRNLSPTTSGYPPSISKGSAWPPCAVLPPHLCLGCVPRLACPPCSIFNDCSSSSFERELGKIRTLLQDSQID